MRGHVRAGACVVLCGALGVGPAGPVFATFWEDIGRVASAVVAGALSQAVIALSNTLRTFRETIRAASEETVESSLDTVRHAVVEEGQNVAASGAHVRGLLARAGQAMAKASGPPGISEPRSLARPGQGRGDGAGGAPETGMLDYGVTDPPRGPGAQRLGVAAAWHTRFVHSCFCM